MNPTTRLLIVVLAGLVTAGCSGSSSHDEPDPVVDITETVRNGGFTTLVTALEMTGLDTTLKGAGPFTLFAPTDAAFADLPPGVLNALLADTASLEQVLLYHVVAGSRSSSDLLAQGRVPSLQGGELTVAPGSVLVNLAEVTSADTVATNGLVHTIDKVLVPPGLLDLVDTAIYNERFTTLVTALELTDLDDVLRGTGPFTVFAPTDAAFAALPPGVLDALIANPAELEQVLLYHVVPGALDSGIVAGTGGAITANGFPLAFDASAGVMVNDAMVEIPDVLATNGIIHAIDEVLLPPTRNIVQIAEDNALNTLVSAIDVAGLRSTLEGPGPFTVFAPTEAAFANLPPGVLQDLIDNPPDLANVLQYHVLSEVLFEGDLAALATLPTLQGQSLTFVDVPPLEIDGEAKVVIKNIIATNGIVHVIDTVLTPIP
jgi:transforming growth factor-beta-induced protein